MKTCVRARVTGRVQGVGFRPTVFRYATKFGLCGYVCNTPQGVVIEVEGEDLVVGAFFHQLTSAPPKQALIAEFQKEICDSKGYKRFEVVESEPDGDPAVHIPPDLATCDECLHELFDPSNRRNGHAFINCTDCGPRFSIVRDLPYDRDRTSMSKFPMCEPCGHEYHDPSDRRFHAQPNACQRCGPQLRLRVAGGLTHFDVNLFKTKELLRRGRIVAIKGIGGYHLACDATNREAVARLRSRKHRPHKMLAVMFRDIATVEKFCTI